MLTAVGDVGRLRVGHRYAATIRNWTLIQDHPVLGLPRITLAARVTECDQYWITQSPLMVGLFMGQSWWVWTDVEIEDTDSDANIEMVLKGNPEAHAEF